MVRHNNQIPNAHFHKKWADYRVKTWFNQPARKLRRRLAREKKAKAIFPRPTAGALRPVVRSQTKRYNTKQRAGRGFTLEELKEAGIPVKVAPTLGISVDHRRKNRCNEGLAENAKRLKAYKAKLIVFPRRSGKPKNGDSKAEELTTAAQLKGKLLPGKKAAVAAEKVAVSEDMKKFAAYRTLRLERMNLRQVGPRKKKAEEAAKEEAEKAK